MGKLKLLDCTLRDGGFINDWNFGHETIVNIYERAVSAGIDIVEVGFIDERREFDFNRSIMPSFEAVNMIFDGLDPQGSMIVGMIDYGTFSQDRVPQVSETVLDGIRVIFKKKNMTEAVDYCAHLVKKGYKVFVQPVSITGYSDEEMLSLVKMVNDIRPYAMSMVDTYGLLHEGGLLHYFELMDDNLSKNIAMGYHAHNNFQLGYSNSIALMERVMEKNTDRQLVIDGSVYGMGKGAGNSPLELLAMYLNSHFDKNYDLSQILEAIDVSVMKIYLEKPWGYSMQYFLAASNDCHPKYVQQLINKRTLSVKAVNEILSKIDCSEKLAYNEEHIEDLYKEYQENGISDKKDRGRLKKEFLGREILIVGPGSTISTHSQEIMAHINKYKPLIITINYLPALYDTDYIFVTNAKRYVSLEGKLLRYTGKKPMLVATSNVTRARGNFDYCLDYASLIDKEGKFPDSSLIMLLKLISELGICRVSLAGFDGYEANPRANYFDLQMEYTFVKKRPDDLNEYMSTRLKELSEVMDLDFITPSKYRI